MIYILTFLLILTISILIYYSFRVNEDRTVSRIDRHFINNNLWIYTFLQYELDSLYKKLSKSHNVNQALIDIKDLIATLDKAISDLENLKNEKRD